MIGNLFIQAADVIVEGVSIGSFESVEINEDAYTLGSTAIIRIPLYTIGLNSRELTYNRVRAGIDPSLLKVGSRIQIFTWYKNNILSQDAGLGRIMQFDGYIRKVEGGFPSTIHCEDASFILKFGDVADFIEGWRTRTSLRFMLDQILPKANMAFRDYRRINGFKNPDNFIPLSYNPKHTVNIEFALQIWGKVSPFYALQHVVNMFYMQCGINSLGQVFIGSSGTDFERPIIELATNTNVIGRQLTTKDGMFENYQVTVSGFVSKAPVGLSENEKYTAGRYTYSLGESNGETVRLPFTSINTSDGIKALAQRAMERLRRGRNQGTIDLLLYPHISLFDTINYKDTLYPDLSSKYKIIGRQFTSSQNNGFMQSLNVTNELFSYI